MTREAAPASSTAPPPTEDAREPVAAGTPVAATATLVVHARRMARRPRLAIAARTQSLFQQAWATGQVDHVASPPGQAGRVWRTGPVRAPRVVDHGRTSAVEWLLEEHITGAPVARRDRAEVAWHLVTALDAVWSTHVTYRRARPRPWAALKVAELLNEPAAADLTAHPHQMTALRAALVRLGTRGLVVAHGPRHGDPVLGNVLRATHGHLVLLDWELAGPGPLATDLVKLALTLPSTQQGWQLLQDAAPPVLENLDHNGPTTATWREQVALALMVWLSGWRTQRRTHDRSGRADAYDRRLRRRLALLTTAALDG